jgi:Holliday junction resolvase RusA-like endonuclease
MTAPTRQATEQEYEFVVPGEPVPFTRTLRGEKSTRAEKYRAYKKAVGYCANLAGVEPMPKEWHIILTVHVYSVNHARRKWDADNVLKAVSDGLNGIAWHDDKQITSAHVRLYSRGGSGEMETRVWIQRST